MSAHDLALYGTLFLNEGQWKGQQLIPKGWIKISTHAHSVTNETYGLGYGMLWNVLMKTDNRSSESFYHTGVGVHLLEIYPASKLVVVHRVDTENGNSFRQENLYQIVSMIFEARFRTFYHSLILLYFNHFI